MELLSVLNKFEFNLLFSLIIGLMVSVVPYYCFKKLFFSAKEVDAQQMLKRLYLAEVSKVFCLMLLSVISLLFLGVNFRWYFVGFITAELSRFILMWTGWFRAKVL